MCQDEYYQYFVEGEDEEKLVKVLKTDMQLIAPGKVSCFNVVEKKLKEICSGRAVWRRSWKTKAFTLSVSGAEIRVSVMRESKMKPIRSDKTAKKAEI